MKHCISTLSLWLYKIPWTAWIHYTASTPRSKGILLFYTILQQKHTFIKTAPLLKWENYLKCTYSDNGPQPAMPHIKSPVGPPSRNFLLNYYSDGIWPLTEFLDSTTPLPYAGDTVVIEVTSFTPSGGASNWQCSGYSHSNSYPKSLKFLSYPLLASHFYLWKWKCSHHNITTHNYTYSASSKT